MRELSETTAPVRDHLLFLSGHVPSGISRQAGHKTAFRNLRWLAGQYRIRLLAFRSEADREEPVEPLQELCESVEIVEVSRASRLLGVVQRPWLPWLVACRYRGRVRQWIRQELGRGGVTRVHAEWASMAQYAADFGEVGQRSLYLHDVIGQWAQRRAQRRAGLLWRAEAWRTRGWERRAYARFTRVLVPSSKDGELIRAAIPDRRTEVEVLALHYDRYGSAGPRTLAMPVRLLFWGALGRTENASAARWLCRELAPRLRAAGLPFVLSLVGSNPPPDLQGSAGPDVEVPGFLADPGLHFDRAHLAVLPLFEGAGVKVKVLECLAAGLPVVTTEIGAEGIHAGAEDGLMVLPAKPEAFAEEVRLLASDAPRVTALSRAAQTWARRELRVDPSVLLR